ncbi:M67 family metallopeptidase [Paenibacillus macerans]|uniref:M67 family metallopeptidase n=1 Tax=Paenibacillus macerans TaxID=44252 RepID=UPI003D31F38A
MNQKWILPSVVRTALTEDGQRRYPEEACGLLFGTIRDNEAVIERYLPVPNRANDPLKTFELDPEIWIKSCFDAKLIGVYHTHPAAPPLPSPKDLRELPNFAAQIKLYAIGSPAIPKNKPPGEPDGYHIKAYVIEPKAGSYSLRPVPWHVDTDQNKF